MERRDIRGSKEWLRMGSNDLKIKVRNDLCRAIAATQALYGINARIGEHRHQILRTLLRAACMPVCTRQRSLGQLDAISTGFPPRDTPQHIRIGIVGAGWGDNADCPSWWEGVGK